MATIGRPEIEAGCRWLASVQEIRGLNGHDEAAEREYFARRGAEGLLAIRDRMVPPADPDETPLLGRAVRCGPGYQDYARIRITPGRAEGYLPGATRPAFVWPIPADYLPPAHRRLLAEAIGAGDFAEHPEAWETSRYGLDDASRFAYCLKHSDGDGGLSVVEYRRVPVAEPPSSWPYWCGQCPACGVIYWHRGEERRDDPEGRVFRAIEDLLRQHNAVMSRDAAMSPHMDWWLDGQPLRAGGQVGPAE